jgi:hypothetical protein
MQLNGLNLHQDTIKAEMPFFIANKYLYLNDINHESFDHIKKE